MYLAVDGQAAGFIALSDTLRPEAPDMIKELKAAGGNAGSSDGRSWKRGRGDCPRGFPSKRFMPTAVRRIS